MKKPPLSLARRYARALLDVAQEQGRTAALAPALASAADLLAHQADLARVLHNPAVGADKKKHIVAAVWHGTDPLLARLLALLVDRGRLALLPAIAAEFLEAWNASRGIVAAEAVSALPLDASQQQAVAAAAKTLAGAEVTLTASVDPRLLGGVVLRMNGRTYDGSVRAQVRRLRSQLTAGAEAPSTHSAPRS